MKKVLFILLALSISSKVVCSANALASMEEREFPVIETFVTETDGMYNTPVYLYNVKANKFFVGANEWGTRASVGSTGWKVKVLKHLDSQQNWDEKSVSIKDYIETKNGWYALGIISNELWTDCASQRDTLWTILKHGDYYRFEASTKNPVYNNFSGTFLGVNLTEGDTRLYPDKADTKEDMIDWAIVTEKRYEEYQRELLIYNKAQELKTWIEKCDEKGLDASGYKEVYQNLNATMEELENAIAQTKHDIFVHEEENASVHNPADMTSQIVNPSYDNNRDDGWEGNKFYTSNNVAEYYERNFTLYQDLANLPKGVYAIHVQAFCRNGWAEDVLEQYEKGKEMPTRLYAGTKDFTTSIPIKNICEGMSETSIEPGNCSSITDNNGKTWYIPNNMEAAESFFNDAQLGEKYMSTLIFGTDGDTIRFGLQQDKLRAGNWVLWDNWQLTYYGNQVEAYQLWLDATKMKAPRFDENDLITKSLLETYNKSLNELTAHDYTTALEAITTIEGLTTDIQANIKAWENFQEAKEFADYIIQEKRIFWNKNKRELDDYMKAKGNLYLEELSLTTEEIIKETNYIETLTKWFNRNYQNGYTLIGAVWSYVHFDRTGEEEQNSYTRYTILNEPIEIERTTYVPLVEYNTCEFQKEDEIRTYRIRQEGQRIYILKEDAAEIASGLILKEEGNDYVLYDFELTKGEEFCKISNNNQSITISDSSTITTIDGTTFNTLHILDNEWIEGIGSVHGLLDLFWSTQVDCDCGTILNYFSNDRIDFKTEYKNPFGDLLATSTAFKPNDCALGADAIEEVLIPNKASIQTLGQTIFCTSPTAVKMEVYTMDAIKVGESAFVNGEAAVKVNKAPAIYLYIVTYPNGHRESGKVMVK